MFYILLALYAIVLLIFVILYFFIVYHLAKYSLNAQLNKILLPLFIVVSTLLLFSNVLFFSAVDWKSLLTRVFIF